MASAIIPPRRLACCLSLAAIALGASAAAGGVTYESQLRVVQLGASVSGDEGEDNDQDSAVAPDFGPFDRRLHVVASVAGGEAAAIADAEQQSSMDGAAHRGTLRTSGRGDAMGHGTAAADASNILSVQFRLDAPTPVRVSGILWFQESFTQGEQEFASWLRLEEVGSDTLIDHLAVRAEEPIRFDDALRLTAGLYEITVVTNFTYSTQSSGACSTAADFELALPAPGTWVMLGAGVLGLSRRPRNTRES